LPSGAVVHGELVVIDETGRPNFNPLQNSRIGASRIGYYVFDVVCLNNRDTTALPPIEPRVQAGPKHTGFAKAQTSLSPAARGSIPSSSQAMRQLGGSNTSAQDLT